MKRRTLLLAAPAVAAACALALTPLGRRVAYAAKRRLRGTRSLEQRLAELGPAARERLAPLFAAAGLAYPPEEVLLVGWKAERRLVLFASSGGRGPIELRDWPLTAWSGTLGPKLREGDGQIPEGRYRIEALHPNSAFHLSLRLDYPSAFDREMAARDGRRRLGNDIMIHGREVSDGCLAIGDPAIEELFTLVADVGPERTRVLIAPCDLRAPRVELPQEPAWLPALYAELRTELDALPLPQSGSR